MESSLFVTTLFAHALKISIILAVAYAAQFFIRKFIEQVVRRSIRRRRFKSDKDEMQREDTVVSILNTGLYGAIFVSVVLMIMQEFSINIGPLIAGAGVAGVALGFGAQYMVKDFLAGLFIIAENQYRVGDVLQVNQGPFAVSGTVELISLRQTVLRDLQGRVHHISNGNIQVATNLTMDYSNVELDVCVGYESDLKHVEKVINRVGMAIFEYVEWKGIALEPPHMLRVDEFTDSGITIKIICKTAPIRQWEVKGEILKQLKIAFDKEKIVLAHS